MKDLCFVIPGEAVAKGRPRATTIGGRARMFTPAKTERYESKVALFASQAMAGRPLLDCALRVQINVWIAPPVSWSGKKRRAAFAREIYPTSRPDADNVAKAVTDACNGVVWTDDSRIVDLRVRKNFALEPRVVVEVSPVGVATQPNLLEAA